jgi:hypothetical protein
MLFVAIRQCVYSSAYFVVITFVPRCTVHQFTLEVMKPGDLRPLPIIQGTRCLNHNLALIVQHGARIDSFNL